MSIERKTPSSADHSRSRIIGRRGLLCGLAAVPASAALAAATLPAPAAAAPDPIFAAIEAHKAAAASVEMILHKESELEETLPSEMRLTQRAWEIVETDDPRWKELTLALDAGWNSVHDAAFELLGTDITTIAGVIAFLEHTSAAARDRDWQFPDYTGEEEFGLSQRFYTAAARAAVACLHKIAGGSNA